MTGEQHLFGLVSNQITTASTISADIPNFQSSTVKGFKDALILKSHFFSKPRIVNISHKKYT